MIGEWRLTDTGQCSRPHCREPAVAMLNRGQRRTGHTRDAWWRYCAEHLADYGKHIRGGQVAWLPGRGPVENVDTGGRL